MDSCFSISIQFINVIELFSYDIKTKRHEVRKWR